MRLDHDAQRFLLQVRELRRNLGLQLKLFSPCRCFRFGCENLMRHGSLLSSVPFFLFLLFFASPEEDYRAGVSLFEQGRLAEAAERLRTALAATPDNAQYAKALGVSLAAQKRYAEADEPFARACTINPKLTD